MAHVLFVSAAHPSDECFEIVRLIHSHPVTPLVREMLVAWQREAPNEETRARVFAAITRRLEQERRVTR